MTIVRNYTTPAYYPRTDSRSVQHRDAKLDVAYAVHSAKPDTTAPSPKKFNLVFVHGAQFCKEGWNYWIDLSFKHWGDDLGKCITLDHVHHGDSAVLNEGKVGFFIPWEDQGRDVGCVIRDCVKRGEIDASAPLIVIAHSMSGTGMMGLAAYDPGLITAMVIIDPVWLGPHLKLEHADMLSGKFARMSRSSYRKSRDTFDSMEDYTAYITKGSIFSGLNPRIEKDLHDGLYHERDGKIYMKTSRAHQAAAYYAGMSAAGMGESLVRRVRAPTFILHGDIHDFNPEGSNEALEKVLPHSQRGVIHGAKHLVCYTHPEECFNTTKDFITEQAKSHIAHVEAVNSRWGPSAEERFLEDIELRAQGNQPAGFSKL